MDDTPARTFFLHPTDDPQRLYEALCAVIIEGCRQKEVADRFGYGYAAFRQQVRRFRARCAAGQPPPFSLLSRQTTRYPLLGPEGRRSSPQSPTAAP